MMLKHEFNSTLKFLVEVSAKEKDEDRTLFRWCLAYLADEFNVKAAYLRDLLFFHGWDNEEKRDLVWAEIQRFQQFRDRE